VPDGLVRKPGQHGGDPRFDRVASGADNRRGVGPHAQQRAAVISPIGAPFDQAAVHQALQDAGQRARVQVDPAGEVSRRQVALAAHQAQDQPLRPRHAEPAFHPFRAAPQRVLDLPEQPQHLEYLGVTS